MNPFLFFVDPVLRAPTIGCMLMCLSAALVGVVTFLRKQSLLGESLSHAAFPGLIFGVLAAGGLSQSELAPFIIIFGAFLSALLGLLSIYFLEKFLKIRPDSALCFVLSVFFGIGITLASRVQFTETALYKQSLSYLYGQAATMTDIHIFIYGILSFFVLVSVLLFYKEIQAVTFDRDYSKTVGIRVYLVEGVVYFLIVLAIVIGIRSVGVVLMSAMLIAPAAAARQYTNKLSRMLVYAGIFGLISGYLGNYFSVLFFIPTGPMIALVAGTIAFFSLLFAPERGLITRMLRILHFRTDTIVENILKSMWRHGEAVSFKELAEYHEASIPYLFWVLRKLKSSGWITKTHSKYKLTSDGQIRAAHIVRLHRLWEVYLADYLGVGAEKVHHSAEEMEHILTPEIEKELTILLKDPKIDPHQQPIPPKNKEPDDAI